ncbi:MAG TPA: hypothetical protein VN048_04570 [Verrucomicrobiae bacterium]|nr:hypothetical protein [Verrucomicrobiae bacterium]
MLKKARRVKGKFKTAAHYFHALLYDARSKIGATPAAKASLRHCERGEKSVRLILCRAESAREKDNKTNQQNQTNPAAANHRPPEVKPAAAEQ